VKISFLISDFIWNSFLMPAAGAIFMAAASIAAGSLYSGCQPCSGCCLTNGSCLTNGCHPTNRDALRSFWLEPELLAFSFGFWPLSFWLLALAFGFWL
jgi:hypothetical protein